MGAEATDLLHRLLRLAVERDSSLESPWAASALMTRWLGELSATVQRGVGLALVEAAGSTSARRRAAFSLASEGW